MKRAAAVSIVTEKMIVIYRPKRKLLFGCSCLTCRLILCVFQGICAIQIRVCTEGGVLGSEILTNVDATMAVTEISVNTVFIGFRICAIFS